MCESPQLKPDCRMTRFSSAFKSVLSIRLDSLLHPRELCPKPGWPTSPKGFAYFLLCRVVGGTHCHFMRMSGREDLARWESWARGLTTRTLKPLKLKRGT